MEQKVWMIQVQGIFKGTKEDAEKVRADMEEVLAKADGELHDSIILFDADIDPLSDLEDDEDLDDMFERL